MKPSRKEESIAHVEWLKRGSSEITREEHGGGETPNMLGGMQVFFITLRRLAIMNCREAG